MSELQVIQGALEQAARRRRLARAFRGLWAGFLIGACLWLLVLTIFKLIPIPAPVLLWTPAVALACPLIGFFAGGWRRLALPETARWVDARRNLKERLSTALEVARLDNSGFWTNLVLADAAAHAREIDPRRLAPIRLPKAARWTLLALALAAGLGFVPEHRGKGYLQQKADERVIKEAGKQLADLTRRSIEKRPPALETTKASMESVAELGDQLAKQSLTRAEALKDLANAADKLKDELKEFSKSPALKKLEEAARGPEGGPQNAEGLRKQIESLQKQMASQSGSPDAMDKLQQQLSQLQQEAKEMAEKTGAGKDAASRQLSQSLSSLSRQAAQMGVELPQLDEAIAALAANQTDLFLKDLQSAMTDLDKLRDMAKSLEQMQAQMEQVGKDLAEQLKNGQAEAAKNTLEKMARDLKSAGLAPEGLLKIMQEVSKATGPAEQYGKVADDLKAATGQCQSGDRAGASQSLADAANELDKLLKQMGDAQNLMATMDNLQKASMCVGTCQAWGLGMCNKPGLGKGSRPGGGVGTWADENGGWGYDGQWSTHWDNTGLKRPDMDSRGITERDQTLSDALKPDKVRGQFSPGGSMPSITLKDVSIKGQSKVAYEEVVSAAQSDAQSALSQEKVPRAYQGAVRDYFDDLKK